MGRLGGPEDKRFHGVRETAELRDAAYACLRGRVWLHTIKKQNCTATIALRDRFARSFVRSKSIDTSTVSDELGIVQASEVVVTEVN